MRATRPYDGDGQRANDAVGTGALTVTKSLTFTHDVATGGSGLFLVTNGTSPTVVVHGPTRRRFPEPSVSRAQDVQHLTWGARGYRTGNDWWTH